MDRRDFTKVALGTALAPLLARPEALARTLLSSAAHPVFKPEISPAEVGALRANLRTLIAMDERKLLGLIPVQTGFISCDCPNCDQGAQGLQLQWSVDEPEVLTCRYCGHRYPSQKYPDDKVLEVKDPLGRMQRYRYYQDASGLKYFFEARRWRLERDYFDVAGYELAELYYFSSEKPLARKVALILDRFAQLYPGFIVVRESQQSDQGFQDHPPYQTQGGKWGRWYYDEVPRILIQAYDLIYDSGELEALSRERGADVKRRIEEEFFCGAVRHVRTYPENYSNASPSIYWGLAVLGRVVGEPDYVHDAVRRVRGIFENSFMFDGFWMEGSINYHRATLRGLEPAIGALEGYSDPTGYLDPTDRARFDGLNVRQQVPMLPRAWKTIEKFCYPDGRSLAVHDAWSPLPQAKTSRHENPADQPYREFGKPLPYSSPELWPALGHAYLGRGRGPNQMEVHLHFSGAYGHTHNDNLNLSLFALGEELLPDLGYSHSRYRYWTRSTLAHNTVLVDGREQYSGSMGLQYSGPGISYPESTASDFTDGNLLLFEAAGDDFQVVEASGERGYPGLVNTYRRTVIMVGIDEQHGYVVDLFRVAGGQRHEWALHGSADRDQELSVNGALDPYGETLLPSGVKFVPPKAEYQTGTAGDHNPAYGFVRDVRRTASSGPLVATFNGTGTGASLRVHLFTPDAAEVLVGRAPSIRRAEENDAQVDQFWMPMLICRKQGNNLSESYLSVMEPFKSEPFIQSVERMEAKGGYGLKISAAGWTDYLVYRGPQQGDEEVVCGKLRLKGRLGWIREHGGKPVAMCLGGGTGLSFGEQTLGSVGTLSGRVTGVLRKAAGQGMDAFEVEGDFPSAVDLVGWTAIVHHHGNNTTHGYHIAGLKREGQRTLLVLDDEPGFELDNRRSRSLFFPKREIEGEVTYSISSLAFSRR